MTRNNSHGTHKGSSRPVGVGQPNLSQFGVAPAEQTRSRQHCGIDTGSIFQVSYIKGHNSRSRLRCFAVAVFVVVLIVHLRSGSNHRGYWRLTASSSFLTPCVPCPAPLPQSTFYSAAVLSLSAPVTCPSCALIRLCVLIPD